MLNTVHVVAWRWNDGAGNRWWENQEAAQRDYRSQVACEVELFEAQNYEVDLFAVELPWDVPEGEFGRMAVSMYVEEWLGERGF